MTRTVIKQKLKECLHQFDAIDYPDDMVSETMFNVYPQEMNAICRLFESEFRILGADALNKQTELLKKFWQYFDKECVAVNCNDEERSEVIKEFLNSTNNSYSIINPSKLSINQKVKRNYPESRAYWVEEILGEEVLIRTTEAKDDPEYDDFWVNVSEIHVVQV